MRVAQHQCEEASGGSASHQGARRTELAGQIMTQLAVAVAWMVVVGAMLSEAYRARGPLPNRHLFRHQSLNEPIIGVRLVQFNTLFRGFASTGDVVQAEALLRKMRIEDLEPDRDTYESLIDAWLNKDVKDRLVVSSDDDGNKDKDIDMEDCNAVEEAEMIFNQLLDAGFSPTRRICGRLIHAFGDNHRPEQAEIIFDKISFFYMQLDVQM